MSSSPAVRPKAWARFSELLGSMRFAISSLSILAIASIIGTLLKQREPFPNYVNQFGPFWADLFNSAGIYEVYNAPWFLLVLAFLIVSTSLCVLRNTPKMLREMRAWRDKIRANSLRAFKHHGEFALGIAPAAAAARAKLAFERAGYQVRTHARDDGVMLAARRGGANRLGYVFTHVGIVVIALGGLLDSELPLRAMVALRDLKPLPASATLDNAPESARLPIGNPSWRGNVFMPEGSRADTALVAHRDGVLLQPLPFALELKQFRIDYYSTGMPKLFASDVEVIDPDGKRISTTIKVNEPLIHNGLAVYQSSFDDGGSKLELHAIPLAGAAKPFEFKINVGEASTLNAAGKSGTDTLRLEVIGFRPINVENLARGTDEPVGEQKFRDSVATVLSPSANSKAKNLRNVGPSFQYKLRDPSGQAREFNVYQLPVDLEGQRVILAGIRENPNEGFRYLRIPVDEHDGTDEFFQMRTALADQPLRTQAAERFAARVAAGKSADAESSLSSAQLADAARKALELFAAGGMGRLAEFLEKSVPAEAQQRTAGALGKLLNSALWEVRQLARERAGQSPANADEAGARWLEQAQNALSDLYLFDAPVLLTLSNFTEVKASVFQVTRSPGKKIVYLGCLSLVLGVFAMFYIRERRLWCWFAPSAVGATSLLALSASRPTLDLQREYQSLSASLLSHCGGKSS